MCFHQMAMCCSRRTLCKMSNKDDLNSDAMHTQRIHNRVML